MAIFSEKVRLLNVADNADYEADEDITGKDDYQADDGAEHGFFSLGHVIRIAVRDQPHGAAVNEDRERRGAG